MATQTNDFKKGAASFRLRGKLRFTPNTFTLNKKSDSGFISNQMYLGVDCGKGNVVYARMFDGYFGTPDRQKKLYLHGKKADPSNPRRSVDDFSDQFVIDWSQRFMEDYVDEAGPACFTKVAVRYDKNGELITDRYLSPYDAIAAMAEFAAQVSATPEAQEVVAEVRGNLEYQYYDGRTTCQKRITSIRLRPDLTEADFEATFTQMGYVSKDGIGTPDMEKKLLPLTVYVPDYVGKYNGIDVKKTVPLSYEMTLDATAKVARWLTEQIKKSNGYARFTFRGDFVESGTVESIDLSEMNDEIKGWVANGVLSEEDVRELVAAGTQRVQLVKITNLAPARGTVTISPDYDLSVYTQKEMDALAEPLYAAVAASKAAAEKTAEPVVDDDDDNDDDLPFDLKDEKKEDDADNMDWLTNFM